MRVVCLRHIVLVVGYRIPRPEAAGTLRANTTDPCWLVMILGLNCRGVFDSLKEICRQQRPEGTITPRLAMGYGPACWDQNSVDYRIGSKQRMPKELTLGLVFLPYA